MIRTVHVMLAVLCSASAVLAGARIDLRPNPPVPPGGYAINTVVQIDTYLVDIGNTQDVSLRSVLLDSSATDAHLSAGPNFNWINPFGVGAVFPWFPSISWVYPLPNAIPQFQITIPDDGEVKLGDFPLNVGNTPGIFVLDLTTNASLSLTDGSAWTFANGNLTGGRADIPVQIPEPASLVLVSLGGLAAARMAGGRNRRWRVG